MRKHHHMKAPARIMNERSKHREASRRIVIRLPFFDSYPVFHEEIVNVLMEQLNMSKKAPLSIVASR